MKRVYPRTHGATNITRFVALQAKSVCSGFHDDACCDYYLRRLLNSLPFYHVVLHAYVVLPDKLWLLLTPRSTASLSHLLDAVNRAYCDYFNSRFARRLSQWQGRITHVAVRDDQVLACHKFIEAEPVWSGRVAHPGIWRWSSYHLNAFGGPEGVLTRHLALNKFLRQQSDPYSSYRAYIDLAYQKGQREFLIRLLQPASPSQDPGRMNPQQNARTRAIMPKSAVF